MELRHCCNTRSFVDDPTTEGPKVYNYLRVVTVLGGGTEGLNLDWGSFPVPPPGKESRNNGLQ